jgi:hypothetical protein
MTDKLPAGYTTEQQLDALIGLATLRDGLSAAVFQSNAYLDLLPEGPTKDEQAQMHVNLLGIQAKLLSTIDASRELLSPGVIRTAPPR